MIYDADCRMAVQTYGYRLPGSIAWLTNVILAAHELDSYVHTVLWRRLGTPCHDDSIANTDVPNLLRNDFYDKLCADLRDVPWEVRLRTRKRWPSESRNPSSSALFRNVIPYKGADIISLSSILTTSIISSGATKLEPPVHRDHFGEISTLADELH